MRKKPQGFNVQLAPVIAAAAALAMTLAGAALTFAGPAAASPVHTGFASPEQAGYITTGARFRDIRTSFVLPDASAFAGNIGAFGLSVQLWSSDQVEVLGISTCTTSSCAIGGPPDNEPWNAATAVFDATGTHTVLHSDASSPPMAAGDHVTEEIFYNRTAGMVQFTVTDSTAGTAFADSFSVGPSEMFRQARVGAEFGDTPWSTAAYSAPSDAVHLAGFNSTRLTDYSGQKGSLSAGTWLRDKVAWTRNGKPSGAVNGRARNLFAGGSAFNVFLQP